MSAAATTRAEEMRELNQRLFQVVERSRRDFAAAADALGLTPLQARAVLSLKTPIPMRELADTMACDASNVTGLADRLERLGLVERVPGDEDRRVKFLQLTDAGTRLREDLAHRLGTSASPAARLTRAEGAQLAALLDKMLAD